MMLFAHLPSELPESFRWFLVGTGWEIAPQTGRSARLSRLIIREPCPACAHLRDELFDRWHHSIPYNSSYIDPDTLHLVCTNSRPEIPCPASVPGGLPPRVWYRTYVDGADSDDLNFLDAEKEASTTDAT